MKKPAKKAAPKKTTKKTAPKVTSAVATGGVSRERSVSIRKIDNGFITRVSGMEGKGPNARYVEQETFSKTEPKVTIPK